MNIGLGIEPGLGAEPVAAPSVMKIEVEAAPIAADVTFKCGAREISTVRLQRGTLDRLKPADHGLREPDGGVDAAYAVEAAVELTIGEHQSNIGILQDVAADPSDSEVSALVSQRIVVWNQQSGRAVVG